MADKRFGIKLVCKNCEGKFYSLGKSAGLSCPVCNTKYNLDDDMTDAQSFSSMQQTRNENKDEFADIDSTSDTSDNDNDNDDDVISLDDPSIDEQTPSTN